MTFSLFIQGKGPSGDKTWWEQKTSPSFPVASTTAPTASSAVTEPSSAAGPRSNPFMKGGALEETKIRDAPTQEQERQRAARDQKNPRKEFEAGLMGAVSIAMHSFGSADLSTFKSMHASQRGKVTHAMVHEVARAMLAASLHARPANHFQQTVHCPGSSLVSCCNLLFMSITTKI